MIKALFEYQFLQNAFFAGILASVVCGIIGVVIVEKKLVMMSGGIAHTSYGGVGLGYLMGFEPIIGAFLFSIGAALGIGYIKRKGGARSDVVIGLFWSLGMALGILFIALMPGYPPDLSSYLFGNILAVTKTDLYLMISITLIVTLVIVSLYSYWKAYLFDEEFAFIIGLKTAFMEYLLLVLVAMTVVVLIRVVGIILVLALLTAPAATAGMLTSNLKNRMLYSILFGNVFCMAGLWISYVLNIASGAAIVIISVMCYFLFYMVHTFFLKLKRKRIAAANEKF
ncbi:Zinc ABC transporter, inner membrane permease protein ZnuB [Dehalobacter sp. UNSWDHB]|uniref:metal ABC transporter permease n=1 Tax=Dehalobacter sp. UNSWDHB TaxID=1339256 RepID=UPI0003875D46|nr:iron chelate uptake ABC transporter family permease subunit [Dehalobacter sp. UNSWDHB]EQB22692.1 Zinc ABC transporter, inner membrane permease protein ZnuB [Dehalobacter sp. UNSWDHB]